MQDPIVILHGWGSLVSGEKRFGEVKKLLENKGFTVYTPDLPGFGSNTLKKEELFFEDYVSFVKSFLEKHKLKKIILVGHSFGGRIAIAFTALYPKFVSRLVLASPSGILHPLPSVKKKLVFILTKILRPFFSIPPFSWFYISFRKLVYYSIGEMDYYKSDKLQKTFRNIYQVNILPDLPKISIPTLILWGEEDTYVPVADGKTMHNLIPKSKLIVKPNAGHKFPYENPETFVKDILSFLS